MPGVKTAISLDEDLFHEVNKLAQDLHISRSRLFTLAVRDFLQRQENKKFLTQLNKAYEDFPDPEEIAVSEAMHRKQRESAANA